MNEHRKKVILDVDTGTDDALAILMALTDPGLEVIGITVTQGEKLPHAPSSHSSTFPPPAPHGMSGFGKFMVGAGVVACGGVVAALCAFGYAFYRKRHVAYQEIVTSE